MSVRRVICFLLGIWLGGSLLIYGVATQSFATARRAVSQPQPQMAEALKRVEADFAAALLRHQAGESNRYYFEHWEIAQLVLGVIVFLLLLFGTHSGKVVLALAAGLSLLVAAMHWVLTPEITYLGRAIDFMPVELPSPERARFAAVHRAYGILEALKIAAGLTLTGILVVRSRRRSYTRRKEVHAVDNADHRHVDG